MTKIRAEIDVIDSNYCENEDTTCPMCLVGDWGQYYCALFDNGLEMDEENHCYCKRCEKCKQAEGGRMNKEQVALTLIIEQEAEIEQRKNDYYKAFERLKAQQREIDSLKAENNSRLTWDFVKTAQRHAVKEFAEKLKEKYAQSCSEHYPELIVLTSEQLDELLKEYEK